MLSTVPSIASGMVGRKVRPLASSWYPAGATGCSRKAEKSTCPGGWGGRGRVGILNCVWGLPLITTRKTGTLQQFTFSFLFSSGWDFTNSKAVLGEGEKLQERGELPITNLFYYWINEFEKIVGHEVSPTKVCSQAECLLHILSLSRWPCTRALIWRTLGSV